MTWLDYWTLSTDVHRLSQLRVVGWTSLRQIDVCDTWNLQGTRSSPTRPLSTLVREASFSPGNRLRTLDHVGGAEMETADASAESMDDDDRLSSKAGSRTRTLKSMEAEEGRLESESEQESSRDSTLMASKSAMQTCSESKPIPSSLGCVQLCCTPV